MSAFEPQTAVCAHATHAYSEWRSWIESLQLEASLKAENAPEITYKPRGSLDVSRPPSNNGTLSILKQDKTAKVGIQGRRLRAAWGKNYLSKSSCVFRCDCPDWEIG
jgi:trans-2-enoyl-CoA reductase